MSTYTKGPWEMVDSDGLKIRTSYEFKYEEKAWNSSKKKFDGFATRKNKLLIASVHSASTKAYTVKSEEAEANARLIAAAPELLEALEQIFARKDDLLNEYLCEFEILDARKAIAKAKGEE